MRRFECSIIELLGAQKQKKGAGMLTVKSVKPNGEQIIIESEKVIYNPETHMISCVTPSNDEYIFYFGDTYVMNEKGKTIADYHYWVEEPPKE